jgi:hypothetical protein
MTTRGRSGVDVALDQVMDSAAGASTVLSAWPEDQLKTPIGNLIKQVGTELGLDVDFRSEVTAEVGRPDLGFAANGLLAGHAELKQPGKGARPWLFTNDRDLEQWDRFKSLPNLLYSDGREIALYQTGRQIGNVVPISTATAAQLKSLIATFLKWDAPVPTNPRELAGVLAPLCRFLRDNVLECLKAPPPSPLHVLRDEWETTLEVTATADDFADGYAQTVTYALLLARAEGSDLADMNHAAGMLDAHDSLLADVLRVLVHPRAVQLLSAPIDVLMRCVKRVEPSSFSARSGFGSGDPWLYFYEDFLAEYDADRRKKAGVYYTPVSLVKFMGRAADELLKKLLNLPDGVLADEIEMIDPAAGTGSFPIGILTDAIDRQVSAYPGTGTSLALRALPKFAMFEKYIGPYAICRLRMMQMAVKYGVDAARELPDGLPIYLTDTLGPPGVLSVGQISLPTQRLTEEAARAAEVKMHQKIRLCIGNPPWLRENDPRRDPSLPRIGGWVRFGDDNDGILKDFTDPLSAIGASVHAKLAYELSVMFWRWAIWKVFEQHEDSGLVSFSTTRAYLSSPGHAGMRKYIREVAAEFYVVDLGGDTRYAGARDQNVFDISTGVCVGMALRRGPSVRDKPAQVKYLRVSGTRQEKFDFLESITDFFSLPWKAVPSEPTAPFLPSGSDTWMQWPRLEELFPWQHSGVQFKRTWPIGEEADVLRQRWRTLLSLPKAQKGQAFRETDARTVKTAAPGTRATDKFTGIDSLPASTSPPGLIPYSYRTLDRQVALVDKRLADRIRPELVDAHGPSQLYLSTLLTKELGAGACISVTNLIPDLDFFCNRGAKDIIPVYRDRRGEVPNVTDGLIPKLAESLGFAKIDHLDLVAYVVAVMSAPLYYENHRADLQTPGPRVPITLDQALFLRGVELGHEIVALHTYGDRSGTDLSERRFVPAGRARLDEENPIAAGPSNYPEDYSYDEDTESLRIGSGLVQNVSARVMGFSVSNYRIVERWLGYRMKTRAGRARSGTVLDDIRPTNWTFSRELLELLWTVEALIELGPDLDSLLQEIEASELLLADTLPLPTEEERKGVPGTADDGTQDALFP